MSCHTSPPLDQTVDTDSEISLNEYLNGLTSSSSEERIDQLDHVEPNSSPDGNHIPTLPPMINENNIPNPEDPEGTLCLTNIQNLRSYLQEQCYDGCKWTSTLKFEGSRDKMTFQEIDILQFIGDSSYKDKPGRESYRIYLNPSKYPVSEELSKISALPDDASVQVKTQNRFKSKAYLSKDLRDACGHCVFNVVQNGNKKCA